MAKRGLIGTGFARGLSYQHDFMAQISNEQKEEMLDRQARVDAENRTKLLLEGLDIPEGLNPYDQKKAQEFAESKISELGKFTSQNPDWTFNPESALKVKGYKKEAVDNEFTQRGLRVKAETDAFLEFVRDPKNTEYLDEREVLLFKQALDRYHKTGTISGTPGEEPKWISPLKRVNTSEAIAKTFSTIDTLGASSWGAGVNGIRQYVTDDQVMEAATNLWNDSSIFGKNLRREWADLSDEEKREFSNEPTNWVAKRGRAHVSSDKFIKPTVFAPGSGRGSGSGGGSGDKINIWEKNVVATLDKSISSGIPNPIVTDMGVRGTMVAKDGSINVKNASITSADGKDYQFPDLGLMTNASETGRVRKRTIADPNTGSLIDSGVFEIEVGVEMSIQELKELQDNGMVDSDLIDVDLLDRMWSDIDPSDFEIGKNFGGVISNTRKTNEEGDALVRVNMWMPAGASTVEIYNNGLGNKQKTTSETSLPEEGDTMELSTGRTAVFRGGRWTVQ